MRDRTSNERPAAGPPRMADHWPPPWTASGTSMGDHLTLRKVSHRDGGAGRTHPNGLTAHRVSSGAPATTQRVTDDFWPGPPRDVGGLMRVEWFLEDLPGPVTVLCTNARP